MSDAERFELPAKDLYQMAYALYVDEWSRWVARERRMRRWELACMALNLAGFMATLAILLALRT